MKVSYKEYMNSNAWRKRKQDIFNKRGRECEQCGFQYHLQVHHVTYDNLGNEKDEDLQILCYQCHMSKHDKYFDKYVLIKRPKKKKKKARRKRNQARGMSKRDEQLLKSDFKTLTVGRKRRYLRLKGYNV